MPIKQITPMSEIDRYIEERIKRMQDVLLRNFQYVGEQVLNKARSTNSYKDQTGNLRSSTGYVITVDGRVVYQSDFQTVKDGKNGSEQGAAFARRIATKFPKGICLIVVAGMSYAIHVKNKGYDVIDSAELLADKLVPGMLKQLGLK